MDARIIALGLMAWLSAGCASAAAPPTGSPAPSSPQATAATAAATEPPQPTPTPASTPRPTPSPAPTTALTETTEPAATAPAGATAVGMIREDFEPNELTVTEGRAQFFLDNSLSSAPHNFAIAESASSPILARSAIINRAQRAVLTVEDLPAGTYFFKCEVAGHAVGNKGMVGTLVVEPAAP